MTVAVAHFRKETTASQTAQISFLMPMHNGLEFTRVALRTLQETVELAPHEVVLINDASTDGTAEFLQQLPPPFRVIHQAERAGYAAGMNNGAAIARGEMLCLLNNDLIFKAGWLPPMLRAYDQFPNAGVVGNVQINPRTGKYDHIGVVFDREGVASHFGKHFSFRPFRGYTKWRAVTAACCLVRKSDFLLAGGFDEAYQNGSEDMDLCLALGRLGREHYVANESVIIHHVSSSEGRHQFNSQNEERLRERWRGHLAQNLAPHDHRRFAANYVLRFLTQPWRYNGPKLGRSLLTLLRCGH
jgi:O-antigen biosynthesis protein